MSTNLHAIAQDGQRVPRPAGAGSLTYEPFYGLAEKPFSLSSDPRFLYKGRGHALAFERLHAGIRRREGLIVLTGEIGTGKTTLCRAVIDQLDRRTFATFVPDPFVSREDLLKMLLVDFGVMSIDDVKSGRLRSASRAELSYPLYEFLNSLVPLQAFAVLVIDEAQNLPMPLLEEIRILSDLEGREKLLQVVLVGQPELRDSLKAPQVRQVDQRVSVRCELTPLERSEVAAYVAWRLDVAAGGTCESVVFTSDAVDVVQAASGGVPRLINRICDAALHQGHTLGTSVIDAACVAAALEPLGLAWEVAALSSAIRPVDHPQPIITPVADVPPEPSGPVAEFASEAAKPIRAGQSFPLRRTWRDRIGGRPRPTTMLALAGLVLFGATFAASSWYRLAPEARQPRDASLPAPPAHPRLPMAPLFNVAAPGHETTALRALPAPARYIVQVASFEDESRASQLVTSLVAAGYRAYQAGFDLDGERWWQVSVGPHTALVDAEAELARIRQIPGYDDATIRTLGR